VSKSIVHHLFNKVTGSNYVTYDHVVREFVEHLNRDNSDYNLMYRNEMLNISNSKKSKYKDIALFVFLNSPDITKFMNFLRESIYDLIKSIYIAQNDNTHPLLNPNSRHYDQPDGREGIELLESMFTTEQLKSWALITAMKYRLRIGRKDDGEKELLKIKTYEDYYKYLNEKEK